MEINTADYHTLLRVPGIGTKSAWRIIGARRYGGLDFEHLKKIGVVLKRALYFITCNGKMLYSTPMEADYILRNILDPRDWKDHQGRDFHQMSFWELGEQEGFEIRKGENH